MADVEYCYDGSVEFEYDYMGPYYEHTYSSISITLEELQEILEKAKETKLNYELSLLEGNDDNKM